MNASNETSLESVARALLARVRGMGPLRVQALLEACDSAHELFEDPEKIYQLQVEGLGKKRKQALHEKLEGWDPTAARKRLRKKNIDVISPVSSSYPGALAEIYDPPPALFWRGTLEVLESPRVAMVGTRRASEHGRDLATEIARGLAEAGVTVVSGMAAGIDGAAHRGALASAEPRTVGVLAHGVDRVYPSRHRELFGQVSEQGLLLSEYPPGSSPSRERFPARNRIISGLSTCVIVVQAPSRSGAIITADFALEQGRDVYTVPGAVGNELHEGCHRLLKQGAGLVESAEDVLEYLQIQGEYEAGESVSVEVGPEEQTVLEVLHERPIHLDEILSETGLSPGECSRILLGLEDRGLVYAMPGQRYQRSRQALHADSAGKGT